MVFFFLWTSFFVMTEVRFLLSSPNNMKLPIHTVILSVSLSLSFCLSLSLTPRSHFPLSPPLPAALPSSLAFFWLLSPPPHPQPSALVWQFCLKCFSKEVTLVSMRRCGQLLKVFLALLWSECILYLWIALLRGGGLITYFVVPVYFVVCARKGRKSYNKVYKREPPQKNKSGLNAPNKRQSVALETHLKAKDA